MGLSHPRYSKNNIVRDKLEFQQSNDSELHQLTLRSDANPVLLLTLPVLSKRGIEMARKFNNDNQWQMQENPLYQSSTLRIWKQSLVIQLPVRARKRKQASRKDAQTSISLKRDEFRHNSTSTGILSGRGFLGFFFFKKKKLRWLTRRLLRTVVRDLCFGVQKGRNVQKHFKNANKSVLLTESTILISANSTCLVLIIPLRFS